MKKILLIFGTRPEAIKMAPLVKEFKENKKYITKVCITAQHREMLDQVLDFFEIQADYDLDLMKPGQDLHSLTANIILSLKNVLDDFNPDFSFVHGDTTTSMAASLACFYSGSKVCHIEAGLRTNNKLSPFPEEINRQITGRISDFHFAPTENSKNNLIKENIDPNSIIITGNTVIDSLFTSVKKTKNLKTENINKILEFVNEDHKVILVTGHRRENHGEGFINICIAIKQIASDNPKSKIIYPVHLNPKVLEPVTNILSNIDNVMLIEPLNYPEFVWLMNRSSLILTDSGGVQEEAPSLGKPVLVMRETTERPEAVEVGTVKLVGTNINKIVEESNKLLNDKKYYSNMSELHNPYGDGYASKRIVKFIESLN